MRNREHLALVQPSPYWTGTRHATRYVCVFCANWYDTGDALWEHIEAEHPKSGPEPCRVADPDGKPQQLPSPTATVAVPRPLGASGPEPFFCADPFGEWIESILEDEDA